MSIGNNISQPYPGPDDGDPPFRTVERPARTPHHFETEEDVARLVRAGMWGPEEVAEYQRRRAKS